MLIALVLLAACGPAATPVPTGLPAPAATFPQAPTARLAPTPVPLTPTATSTPTSVPPAVRVNGQDIPLAAYQLALARCEAIAAAQGQRLEQAGCASRTISTLVEREIVRQAAGQLGITVEDAAVTAQIDAMQSEAGTEAFAEWLHANGYASNVELHADLRAQMLGALVFQHVTASVPVTAEQVHARHILVATEAQARKALQALQAPDPVLGTPKYQAYGGFAAVAAKYSLDEATRDTGGDLGFFAQGMLAVPEIEQAAFALQPGDISAIITSTLGFHLVQVMERDAQHPLPQAVLEQARRRTFEGWLAEQWAAARVETMPGLSAGPLQAPASPGGQVKTIDYVVQPGDAVEALALRFRITASDIIRANALVNPHTLYAGQPLKLPGAALPDDQRVGRRIFLAPGQTLAGLSLRQGVPQYALQVANDLPSGDYWVPGQALLVPGAVETASSLPAPFVEVAVGRSPLVEGGTFVVRVRTSEPVSLTGSFTTFSPKDRGATMLDDPLLSNEETLHLGSEVDAAWAIAGIEPVTDPSLARLRLTAQDARGGHATVDTYLQVLSGQFDNRGLLQMTAQTCEESFPEVPRVEERKLLTMTMQVYTPQRYWTGAFLAPVDGEITSAGPYGTRRRFSCAPNEQYYHEGLDIFNDLGTPLRASAPGRVVLARTLIVRGNAVIVDHGWGVFTGYYHMSALGVVEGQWVDAGEEIGKLGTTGLSNALHVHWEIRVGGIPVNPEDWMAGTVPFDLLNPEDRGQP